jgi:predicted dinucleotide-binding enzyme
MSLRLGALVRGPAHSPDIDEIALEAEIRSNLMDGQAFYQAKPVMSVCGDGSRKKVVLDLVQELGLEAIDAGGSKIARLIEP